MLTVIYHQMILVSHYGTVCVRHSKWRLGACVHQDTTAREARPPRFLVHLVTTARYQVWAHQLVSVLLDSTVTIPVVQGISTSVHLAITVHKDQLCLYHVLQEPTPTLHRMMSSVTALTVQEDSTVRVRYMWLSEFRLISLNRIQKGCSTHSDSSTTLSLLSRQIKWERPFVSHQEV